MLLYSKQRCCTAVRATTEYSSNGFFRKKCCCACMHPRTPSANIVRSIYHFEVRKVFCCRLNKYSTACCEMEEHRRSKRANRLAQQSIGEDECNSSSPVALCSLCVLCSSNARTAIQPCTAVGECECLACGLLSQFMLSYSSQPGTSLSLIISLVYFARSLYEYIYSVLRIICHCNSIV